MGTTDNMVKHSSRYHMPFSSRSPRFALIVSADGLVEVLPLGLRRRTPWARVAAVRWLDHDRAVIERVGGRPIELLPGTERIDELVAGIEQYSRQQHLDWQSATDHGEQIRAWLGLGPGEERRIALGEDDPSLIWLAALGLLIAWEGKYVMGLLLAVLGIVLAYARSRADESRVLSIDEHGLHWVHPEQSGSVAWHELRGVQTLPVIDSLASKLRLQLHTDTQSHDLLLPDRGLNSLLSTLERIADLNNSRFVAGGRQPPADTALSPARREEGDAERGISQVDA